MLRLQRIIKLSLILSIVGIHSSAFSQAEQRSGVSPYQQEKIRANQYTVTVVSGGIDGTYIRFARDMSDVLNDKKQRGLRVLPILGLGGLQNIRDVLFLKGIDMGITQAEYMPYLKKTRPELFSSIEDRVRFITKLYESEWHVIARRDIKSLKDLEGKKVNFWRPFSSTAFTGNFIFKTLNIKVEPVYMDIELALEQVKSGKIAATTMLAGAPVKIVADRRTYENLHLVPVTDPKLLEIFLPSKLNQSDYPNLIRHRLTVPTIASSTILAVYNWPKDTARYRKLDLFVNSLFSNIKKFKVRPWHQKWKSINLAARVPGWKRFEPSARYLRGLVSGNRKKNDRISIKNFKEFINQVPGGTKYSDLSPEEQKKLYRNFLKWARDKQ